ncbi:MAG: Ig-like domain-containing protein, partial [Anaerolineae bacterium]
GQTLIFLVTTDNPGLFDAGPAVDAPTGTLTYEPALNAFGQAVVTVTLQDDGGLDNGGLDTSAPQAFTVTVNAVNDPPVAADDTYDVDEDAVLVVVPPGVLSNDSDVESSPLTATLSSGVSHGLLSLQSDGAFVYTPTADYSGPDGFVYIASDGELSDTASVSINVSPVNDAPLAVGDPATVDEGGTVTVLDSGQTSLLFNDSDPDGDNLALDTTPAILPGHGVVTLTVSGTFTYTHDGSETISDTFTYRACDDGVPSACDTAAVTITVNPVNDAPLAVGDTATVDEGGTVTELDSGQTSLLFNDSDPEGDNLTLDTTPAVLPGHGVVTLTVSGTFTYTHDGSETISDTFTYRACDDGVPSACATAVVSITVTPVQDPPVAVDDTATTYRGGTVTELDSGAASVLDNDYDPDGDVITVRRLITDTAHGTLTWEASGTFTYTHDGSATSSDFFVYEVCDPPPRLCNTATVTITITPFGVRIEGPSSGTPGISYTFTTTVLGPATTPLTYTWEATDQLSVTQFAHPALTHTVPFTWTTDGLKWITVTVSNVQGIVSETQVITIGLPGGSLAGRQFASRIYLPLLLRLGP